MLEVKEIAVRYGRVNAVKDVSLRVDAGELVALIGGNGAGKTTSLKAIMGLQPAYAGAIVFDGRAITGDPPHRIVEQGLALVPEGRQLFPHMSVRENLEVSFARRLSLGFDRGSFKQRFDMVCGYFPRLAEREKQLAGTMSGGEQQMVAIARALMSNPRMLLLDEPSLGLSPIMIETMVDIIRQLHRAGLGILLVEQNALVALEISDRGYVLETGRTVLSSTSADLLGNAAVQKAYLGL